MEGWKEIVLDAWSSSQVESWRPLLRAKRSVLRIWNTEETKRLWLPFSHIGGFEAALLEKTEDENDVVSGGRMRGAICLESYDARFSAIRDQNLKLDIAISRFLYPFGLLEKAAEQYEQLLKNRFRPALLLLVSGRWNWYGKIPARAEKLFALRPIDRFLEKELLEKASLGGQTGFVALLTDKIWGSENGERKEGSPEACDGKKTIWTAAAMELCMRKPEMAPFCGLFSDRKISQGEMGTDGCFLYYTADQEKQMVKAGLEYSARCYTHMLMHCFYRHPFQKRAGDNLFQLACDIAVEYVVDQIFGPDQKWMMERLQVYDTLLRFDPVLTAERIYRQIGNLDFQIQERLRVWFMRDQHHFWNSVDNRGQRTSAGGQNNKESKKAEEKWQEILQQWDTAGEGFLQSSRKRAGRRSFIAGYEQEKAKLQKRQGHDYHDFLRQFMGQKEDRILDLDSYDPVYYTYGLRNYGNIPLVEPLETKEVLRLEELVIVIDTSGSCSGRLVRFFLEETWSVFGQSENFFDQFHVRILQCDAVVQEDVKLTSLQEVDQYMKRMVIKGGGGTDFREAFSYIRKLQKRGELLHLKGILYFTDGFGTFPVRAPDCKTAFIFLKSRYGEVEVPYWADKLLLELPEGADWEPEYTGGFRNVTF